MIVVVEGISASGKTTWCRRNAAQYLVPETGSIEFAPDRASDPVGAAAFWARANATRWKAALEMEASTGTAVCDTDPLKLHYVWCLWSIGEAKEGDWRHELAATRDSFVSGLIGFADHYLVHAVDAETARARKEADPTRMRRNFDLHVRLQPALMAWYRAMEKTRPGSVSFGLPNCLPEKRAAHGRYDVAAFDRMIAALPY